MLGRHYEPVATPEMTTAQLVGIGLSKLEAPLPHGFIGHDDSTLGNEFFDIAQTERKAEIQPHGVTNNLRWKTEPFVIRSSNVCLHEAILAHRSARFPS